MNMPANAGDTGSIPVSQNIPLAVEQLSPCVTTTEPMLQCLKVTTTKACMLQGLQAMTAEPRFTTPEACAPSAGVSPQEKPL